MTEEQFYKLADYYITIYDLPRLYPDRPSPTMLATLCENWYNIPVLNTLWSAESYNVWVDDNEDKMVVFHD